MATEPTLEELRPREWRVSWQYPANPESLAGRWHADDRGWLGEEAAVQHARALVAMGEATGEVRNVEIHSRMQKLDEGEWIECQWVVDA